MYEITIRGLPGLSQEDLQKLTQRFHEFAGRQHSSGRRYESMTALLEDFLEHSCYANKARVTNDPNQEATDIVYQTMKGTFDRPSKIKPQPDSSEKRIESMRQEAMQLIMVNISGFGRRR